MKNLLQVIFFLTLGFYLVIFIRNSNQRKYRNRYFPPLIVTIEEMELKHSEVKNHTPMVRKVLTRARDGDKYILCVPRSGFSNTARAIVSCKLLSDILGRITIMEGDIPDGNHPITSFFEMSPIQFINKTFLDSIQVRYSFKETKKFSTSQLEKLLKSDEQVIAIYSNQFMFLPHILSQLPVGQQFRNTSTKKLFVDYFRTIFKPYGRLKDNLETRRKYLSKTTMKCLQIRTGWIEGGHPFHWSYDCIDDALQIYDLLEDGERPFVTYISFDDNNLHNYIRSRLTSNYYNVYVLSGENMHYRTPNIHYRALLKIYEEYLIFEDCQQVAVSFQSSFGAYAVLRSSCSNNATIMTCNGKKLKKSFTNLLP